MGEDELKPCPFCGAGETYIHENRGTWRGMDGYGEPISVEIRHHCTMERGQPSPRMLAVVGRDRASAVARWNRRAP